MTDRVALLAAVPAFAAVPRETLEPVAAAMSEGACKAGTRILAEGEVGNCLYVLVSGRAEATTRRGDTDLPLQTIVAGQSFGELALLSPGALRKASVTALEDSAFLSLPFAQLDALRRKFPQIEEELERLRHTLAGVLLARRSSPFTALDASRLRGLMDRLRHIRPAAGTEVVKQGEDASACYLVLEGATEVIDADGRRLASLGAGALFGETALLTGGPRNATVRCVTDCELLELQRADLMEAMASSVEVAGDVVTLLRIRDRPRRVAGIEVHTRATADGEEVTVLKDGRRGAYHRLSSQGLFVWERLDGMHALRDLTLDFMSRYKTFAPQRIAAIVEGLAAAGFVEVPQMEADVVKLVSGHAPARVGRYLAVKGLDPLVTRLYRGGVHFVYARTVQVLILLVAALGLAAFAGQHRAFDVQAAFLTVIIGVPLHEAAHAFTVKAFGFEVHRAGIGWYLFTPVAFVDTSDIWLAGRRPRVLVSLAGPYANLVVGSAAALAAPLSPSMLWTCAAVSYAIALVNLCPLVDYDGYAALMDWLDCPDLRARTVAWLRARDRAPRRDEAAYLGFSLAWVALMCLLIPFIFH